MARKSLTLQFVRAAVTLLVCGPRIWAAPPDSPVVLPPGSTLYDSLTLSRFGHSYLVVLYTSTDHGHSATVAVYDPSLPKADSMLLSDSLRGAGSFAQPTGLMKLLGTSEPQIVVYRLLGASCQGRLDIFDVDSPSKVVKLSSVWSNRCQDNVKIEDLAHDGIPEITFTTSSRNPVREIYRWDGEGYKRDEAAFAAVNDRALQELTGQALSQESLPLSARMQWFNEAIDPLIEQRRASEALSLCSGVLQAIRNPERTAPNIRLTEADPQLNKRILASYTMEEQKAEASILRKMGDVYKAVGEGRKAEDLYRQADQALTQKPPES
jgi:hypothetical protein